MVRRSNLLLWCALAAFVALAAACGDDVTVRGPSAPFELFRRVQQFLTISGLLISESRSLWGQGISNAYHAALTLARFKNRHYYAEATEQFHQQVWSQAPKAARKYFRDELRRLRIKYDYHFDWPSDEGPTDDLRDFAAKAPRAFDALMTDTAQIIKRRYRGCSDLHNESRKKCLLCDKDSCERQVMLDEVERVRVQLNELFTERVPRALAREDVTSEQAIDRDVVSNRTDR
jgi:hypothetical protein